MIKIKFYELYVNNLVEIDEIHDFIEEWHTTDFNCKCELYDYLGMTKEQLFNWVDKNEIN